VTRPLLSGALLLALYLADARSLPGDPTRNVLADRLWDDGKAEFSIYRGVTSRYGQDRATEMRLIVVKEDLLRDALVKSERGPVPGKTLEALKLNIVADFQTGTYTYHQMATVFFDRRSMSVLKEVMSHTESCGITFVRVGPENGRWTHEAHSYWDGEADRRVPVTWPLGDRAGLFWDGLPVSLRRWVASHSPEAEEVWVLPSQISGRSPIGNTRPVRARLEVRPDQPIEVPAGRFVAREIRVTTPSGTDVFWFATAFPHVLLKMETASGRKLALERTLRLDYWNHHMNGDEKVLSARAR
jgi:hypothetical protein